MRVRFTASARTQFLSHIAYIRSDAVSAGLGRTEVTERFGRHTPRTPCLPTHTEGDDRANFRHDVGRSMSRRTDALDGGELGDSDHERTFTLAVVDNSLLGFDRIDVAFSRHVVILNGRERCLNYGQGIDSAWFVGKLRSMPHADDPNRVLHNTIEETIGRNDNLAVWQVGKLGEPPSGIRERLQALQSLLCTFAEPCPHASSSEKIGSASAMTSSSSCPSPMAISHRPGRGARGFPSLVEPFVLFDAQQDRGGSTRCGMTSGTLRIRSNAQSNVRLTIS